MLNTKLSGWVTPNFWTVVYVQYLSNISPTTWNKWPPWDPEVIWAQHHGQLFLFFFVFSDFLFPCNCSDVSGRSRTEGVMMITSARWWQRAGPTVYYFNPGVRFTPLSVRTHSSELTSRSEKESSSFCFIALFGSSLYHNWTMHRRWYMRVNTGY